MEKVPDIKARLERAGMKKSNASGWYYEVHIKFYLIFEDTAQISGSRDAFGRMLLLLPTPLSLLHSHQRPARQMRRLTRQTLPRVQRVPPRLPRLPPLDAEP